MAEERCPELGDRAQLVANKYGRALLLFAKCHQCFNSSHRLSDADLSTLGKLFNILVLRMFSTCTFIFLLERDIDEFLTFYRATFPAATITPKMHMIEDHMVPFLRSWRVGLGLLGEQGAESIHARFNQMGRTYNNMRNGVDRLKSVVTEHLRQVCPFNVAKQPPPKKKKNDD